MSEKEARRMAKRDRNVTMRHSGKECLPLDVKWETIDTGHYDGKLLLRRLVLERLGWRLWCEDDIKTRDRTHYVYWVSPDHSINAAWWTEGTYRMNPEYHWWPPVLSLEMLLAPHDWTLRTCTIAGERGYTVTVHGPHGTGAATDDDLEVAAYCALLAARDYSAQVAQEARDE